MVRRSMSSIEPDFMHVASRSPFLQRHVNDNKASTGIALFHRREIVTGQLLGKGGFSVVMEITAFTLCPRISERCNRKEQALRERYAATVLDEKDGCARYCIKHLQERLISTPKEFQCAASDLAVEAAFMSALQHENVLAVRGLPMDGLQAWGNDCQHDGYFLVMDRLSGGTLDRRIHEWNATSSCTISHTTNTNTTNSVNRTALPSIAERADLALQIAAALQYLHASRIVFRDLKPANIGFTADNQVKLFDFGLCRELPTLHSPSNNSESSSTTCLDNHHGTVFEMSGVGTRRYMAPEMIISSHHNNDHAAAARYNCKADVYGWSMVLWEMLALKKPYATYSTDEHRRHVCCQNGERPALPAQWPSWLHNLLRLTWEERVEQRFSMDEACEYLRAGLLAEKENCHNNNNMKNNEELNVTNHNNNNDQLAKKDFAMPDSPTGVVQDNFYAAASAAQSMDHDGSINRHRRRVSNKVCGAGGNSSSSSPPPAPKRAAAFLSIPDLVVRNIALSLMDDDDDNEEVSEDLCSLGMDESFAEHMDAEVWN